MGLGVAARNLERIRPMNLIETITELKREFGRMQEELREKDAEIERLKCRLEKRTPVSQAVSEVDIESVRRKIASFCHPDRGGDTELMSTVNMLLDLFDEQESGPEQLVNSRQAGGVA